MSNKKRVAVALSGGLDSSVVCRLLLSQGYNVVAVTAKMIDDENFSQIAEKAGAVADKLEIPHYIIDLSKDFKSRIIDYFENSYKSGLTPNPCIFCNKTIKWGKLFDFAIEELGCDYFATGHYANIREENGVFKLYPANDEKKDQLYYLFELSQKQLSKTIFPLSGYLKEEIRKIAQENDLPSKSSKESQDICFIKKPMTTKKYLLQKFGTKKGDFILEKTGEKLGVHDGFYQFTIGQRKGIGIAYSEPLYVSGLDSEKNIVYCATAGGLEKSIVHLNHAKTQYPSEQKEFITLVKIRYNMPAQRAKVIIFDDKTADVLFVEPVSSVTPGQACVFYDVNDGHLIGGGWISSYSQPR